MSDTLQAFKQKQEQLALVLDEGAVVARAANYSAAASQLAGQACASRDFRFKIAVLGEFSAGKSTLLNALLGRDVLPAKMPPCTGAPVSITFDERERLHVYRKGRAEPDERPFSDLRSLIVLKADREEEIARERAASDVERIEILTPLELCRNRVWLFDTPGLNEASARTEVTLGLLPSVDAALVVTSACHLLKQSEREFLEDEAAKVPADRRWMDASFLVATFADVAVQDDGPQALRELRHRLDTFCDKLLPNGGFAPGRRFFVDSRAILQRRAGKSVAGDGLEFERLERALGEFVVTQRGAVGLRSQILLAQQALTETKAVFEAEIRALAQDAETTRVEVEQARKALRVERERVERMAAGLRRLGRRAARDIGNAFRVDSGRWLHSDLAQALEAQTYPDTVIVNIKKPAQWFADRAIAWIEARIQRWSNEVPPHMFKELMEEFEDAYRDDLAELKRNITTISESMGISVPVDASMDDSTLGWLLRSAAGFLAGGPLGAIVGNTLGWKGVLTNLAINFGIGAAAAFAGVAIPVVGVVLVAAVVAIGQIMIGQEKIKSKIRTKVLEGMRTELPAKFDEAAAAVESAAMNKIEELAQMISDSGTSLIGRLEEAANAAEAAARRGDADREARLRALADARVHLDRLGQRLSEIG